MSEFPGSFYLVALPSLGVALPSLGVALPSLGVALIHLVRDGALLPSSQLGRGLEKKNAPFL